MTSNIELRGESNGYMLGANGMERLQRVYLHKGTKVIAHGYGMCVQYFVIYDDAMNAVEICEGDPQSVDEYDLGQYFGAIQHVDDTVRPISKKFGIGFYYDESGELVSDEVINRSLGRAKALERLQAEVNERKARESREETERLLKEYSYLTRVTDKYDHKTCGENIRKELKKNFPATKFSVRYSSFAGGDEYSISWQDGPTLAQVDALVKKYQDMHPDEYSCGDYWDCKPSNFNTLYGGVGYVMTNRTISAEAIAKTRERFADLTEDNLRSYPYGIEGAGGYANYGRVNVDDMIHWLARSTDWQQAAPVRQEKPRAEVSGKFEIIDYSEKSFAVVGDTRAIKDELKRLGGRFNARLTCGAGWIFAKSKQDEVKALLTPSTK